MKIADLTPFERRLWDAFPRGDSVEAPDAGDEKAEEGRSWGPDRTVRAEVIRKLLLSGRPADGEIAALRLAGARIVGRLDLKYATVPYPVRFWNCHFERAPILYGMHVRQLNLSECHLPALDAATIRVDGVLRLTGCRIPGEVRLGGSKISGAFFLDEAHLGRERVDELERKPILQLNQATIAEDVWGPRLVVHGQVSLAGATIGGAVNLEEADLSEPGRTVLHADTLTVGANLSAWRLRTDGAINLRGSKIPGQLNLIEARLANPGGVALRASSCTVGELWLSDAAPIDGSVNLRRSRFELIRAAPEVWPAQVRLDGLTYGSLTPHLPAPAARASGTRRGRLRSVRLRAAHRGVPADRRRHRRP
ncbi:hypothetical protein GCM10029978_094410 [Actinoallomurus acanthiterrae]